MAGWQKYKCSCGDEYDVCDAWSNPPSACKACIQRAKDDWYIKACDSCGGDVRAHRNWDRPPKYCDKCKTEQNAKWYKKPCEGCGFAMDANRNWDYPPAFCKSCKDSHPPLFKYCEHCGSGFTIPTGTLIMCDKKGWDLTKRCTDCRELFKYKPFRTERQEGLFNEVVWRTYNSRGDLISESRRVTGAFKDVFMEHRSASGHVTGRTREREGLFNQEYRETRGVDGGVKSTSYEREGAFNDQFRQSVGGSSNTTHETRTRPNVIGNKKNRETW